MTVSYDSMKTAIDSLPAQSQDLPLRDSVVLGFDTETTGITPCKDAIVSACLLLGSPTQGFDTYAIGEWLINPGVPINPRASAVNGFTDEYVAAHGQDSRTAIEQIASIIVAAQLKNIPLVAYNAPFDVRMLEGDLARHHMPSLSGSITTADIDSFLNVDAAAPHELLVVDPLVLDRGLMPKRTGKRTLESTTQYYGVHPHGSFHDATADTVAVVDLLEPMCRLYKDLGNTPLSQVMDWQRRAYNTWKEGFNTWLASKGKSPINESWL